MYNIFKIIPCTVLMFIGIVNANAQKACCSSASKTAASCLTKGGDAQASNAKACCASASKETTSGCTPSNCRGAKTKFGEAKVISELRINLVSLKAKMEKHQNLSFSEQAISVHDIIGENDDESLEIISDHVSMIESELYPLVEQTLPTIKPANNKAVRVKQLGERITGLTQLL